MFAAFDRATWNIGNNAAQGASDALSLTSDTSIGAIQYGDGDGTEATAFLDRSLLTKVVALPVDAQYVKVICQQDTAVMVTSPGQTSVEHACTGSDTLPGYVYLGAAENGVYIVAGTLIEANDPIYVMYEAAATNDEHNLFGF